MNLETFNTMQKLFAVTVEDITKNNINSSTVAVAAMIAKAYKDDITENNINKVIYSLAAEDDLPLCV